MSQHMAQRTHAETDALLRGILCDVLGLQAAQVAAFHDDTGLFGA